MYSYGYHSDALPLLIASHPNVALTTWVVCSIAIGTFQLRDGILSSWRDRSITSRKIRSTYSVAAEIPKVRPGDFAYL